MGKEILRILSSKYPDDYDLIMEILEATNLKEAYQIQILLELSGKNFETLHAIIMDGTLEEKYKGYVLR